MSAFTSFRRPGVSGHRNLAFLGLACALSFVGAVVLGLV